MIPPTLSDYSKKHHYFHFHIDNRKKCSFKREIENLPLVSIITVVKNSEKTIERTIRSVLDQDYEKLEYIIIDGSSNDRTLEIIDKYSASICICTSEPDFGISDAFNKGISLATGEIIGIINSDDWYEDCSIETVVKKFSEGNTDIAHGKLRRWLPDGRKEISLSNDESLFVDSTINHPTVFVKREVYQILGLFSTDFKYAMDYEWLLRAKTSGNLRFSYIDSCLANMSLTGISSQRWIKSNEEVLRAKNIYVAQIRNYLYFYYKVLKGSISSILSENRLKFLVSYYRSNFSIHRKDLEN